ncbi:plasmid partitioning protein RepB [Rhizobium sp. CFBP 8762]|uniref:plasmid partitioning protein RepB n=1 Tax=Rhizobium sp. CFBP 8762 TaxID=2775279 RepID=UPI001781E3F4|nr:plasmid partitioning protein RepB [Rhizobium sp. CFBP 8762]MBD8555236.1 plasmid partitioning protein RepB [Rhizobium sp. CFBP 8762]
MAGGNRKNELKALFGSPTLAPQSGKAPLGHGDEQHRVAPETKSALPVQLSTPEGGEGPESVQTPVDPRPSRTSSGAIKAMGLSLGSITREVEEARALKQALEEGERVVALDPGLIDTSFVEDRLTIGEGDDDTFSELMTSMRDSGQQVPILVRPHPEHTGRFQTAYGHRRLKAAARLGISVKAIVRALSDTDLVRAQGKENAERRNLSFIERALFAQNLLARGFDRKVVEEALAVQKSEVSRLVQVVEAVPEYVVRAIGPAPKTGRARWMALGSFMENDNGAVTEKTRDEIGSIEFKEADSDTRFQMLFNRLSRKPSKAEKSAKTLTDNQGQIFARYYARDRVPRIEFSRTVDQAFLDRMAALVADEYRKYLDQS